MISCYLKGLTCAPETFCVCALSRQVDEIEPPFGTMKELHNCSTPGA